MTNLIELEQMEFINDSFPVVWVTYFQHGEDFKEVNIPAKKMYNTLVRMGLMSVQFEIEGIQQSEPLPFSAMELYINEMPFDMQESLLNDYLLFTDMEKRLN